MGGEGRREELEWVGEEGKVRGSCVGRRGRGWVNGEGRGGRGREI